MSSRTIRPTHRVTVAAACCMSLVVALLSVPPPPANAAQGPIDCPTIMPTDRLNDGMIATGYTVAKGRNVQAFSAEILGVLDDAVGPGRDMIIVDASGPNVDEAGIWAGMSGSPVYFNDQLIGAVAFGLTWGPSSIGGLTPASDMVEVLGYQNPAPPSSRYNARSLPSKIKLSKTMVRKIASHTGTSSNEMSDSMEQLFMPLGVSGVSARGLDVVRTAARNSNLRVTPYAAGSGSASQTVATGSVHAGESFAGALSYGDVTFSGVGTTTLVCDGQALAFGHPFFFAGPTTLGANAADAITIVSDPAFGSYKLATIAEGVGTVDQDRLAAIRASLGAMPTTTPIRTTINSLGLNRTRSGQTDAVLAEAIPFLSLIHLFTNIDVTIDRIGEGSSFLSWTVTGTRASGEPWTLTRSNRYTSEFDISFGSVFELEEQLSAIQFNQFENVEFTDVDVTADIADEQRNYTISKVFNSVDGSDFKRRRKIRVRPGSVLDLRVILSPRDGSADAVAELTLEVPSNARQGGFLELLGSFGEFDDFFFFDEGPGFGGGGGGKINSFDELLESLQNRPRNDELQAKMRLGFRGRVKSQDSALLDRVVLGFKDLEIILKGTGGGGRGSVEPDEPVGCC